MKNIFFATEDETIKCIFHSYESSIDLSCSWANYNRVYGKSNRLEKVFTFHVYKICILVSCFDLVASFTYIPIQ